MPSSTISSLSSSAVPTRTSIFRQGIGIPLPIAPSALCMKRIALCFLVLALLLVAPVVTEPQNRRANTTDLGAELEAYSHYVDDFHAAGQDASGPEFGATDYLQTASSLAFERLLALNFTLRVYRSISCTADRKQANDILRQQLSDTAFKFENDGDRIGQMLVFVEVPATAQLGLKLKDDMRATKDKLDKIAASLNSSK